MLNISSIQAISLDLDDTLWPTWPPIERAEQALLQWLHTHAPRAGGLFGSTEALRAIREETVHLRPDLQHDLSALRRESIRLALLQAGEDGSRAEEAFEVFFAERQRVDFYPDALPALEWLAARFPLVALSNGNADVHRVGIGRFFTAALSARGFGVAKPDPRIFHAAAQAAGVAPQAVLHVGDDAALDAWGAMQAGQQAAWLNRSGQPWPHPQPPHVAVAGLAELCALLGAG